MVRAVRRVVALPLTGRVVNATACALVARHGVIGVRTNGARRSCPVGGTETGASCQTIAGDVVGIASTIELIGAFQITAWVELVARGAHTAIEGGILIIVRRAELALRLGPSVTAVASTCAVEEALNR